MPPQQRTAYVKELTRRRAKLQAEITALSQERDQFLAAQREAESPNTRFDQALIEAVKQQAGKQGIKLKN